MPASLPRRFAALAITATGVAIGVASGCRSSATAEPKRIQAHYDSTTGRLARLEYDSNGDGRPDTWAYMDGTRLHRLEADHDGDGRIDRWEHYDDSAPIAGAKPVPLRIESAKRLDGRISRREFFERGELARIEEDTDGDGVSDKWETYADGILMEMALDTQHRGRPNRRFIYRADGALDRIEVDPTGAGRFQRVQQ